VETTTNSKQINKKEQRPRGAPGPHTNSGRLTIMTLSVWLEN